MFHLKKNGLTTLTNLELKEFPRLDVLLNTKNKLELKKSPDKLPLLTTMPLNILDNTFLNIFLKDKLNTLLKKERSKSMNTFQLKDKSFIILNNNYMPEEFLEDIFKVDQLTMLEEDHIMSAEQQLTTLEGLMFYQALELVDLELLVDNI